ncbi:hypothetical protein BLNAU_10962 [Blattamonas nauphoetae]|uniref:Uncharacterized protein n=1 Tax=Blattamonas nauphoetae TaxID=2049346 RepID=A0ABQ9XSY8_9EUKA|nr:hypothetical protein BLNAU_10962 [Blattamonas nauphoetae]
MDCSPFLNWDEEGFDSEQDRAVVFLSLVSTLKSQPALDVSLEAKAVKLLNYMEPYGSDAADAFLRSLASSTDESLTNYIQSIVVLLSSASQTITTAAIEMVKCCILNCSIKIRILLVKADVIPQLIIILNPHSLSFTEAVDIHSSLISSITSSFLLATPEGLEKHGIEDGYERQAVRETVLKQVITPSAEYIWHLCANRYSIVDRGFGTGGQP